MLDVTVKVIKKAPSENLKKSKEIYLNNSLKLYLKRSDFEILRSSENTPIKLIKSGIKLR